MSHIAVTYAFLVTGFMDCMKRREVVHAGLLSMLLLMLFDVQYIFTVHGRLYANVCMYVHVCMCACVCDIVYFNQSINQSYTALSPMLEVAGGSILTQS